MLKITLDTKDDKNIQKLFIDMGKIVHHPIKALKSSGEIMYTSIQKNFDVNGRPKWIPLKQSTINNRRVGKNSTNKGLQILQDTGVLRMSIIESPVDESSNSVDIGTSVPYASVHQYGAMIQEHIIVPRKAKSLRFFIGDKIVFAKKVKIPAFNIDARPFLMFQPEDIEDIEKVFAEEILTLKQ